MTPRNAILYGVVIVAAAAFDARHGTRAQTTSAPCSATRRWTKRIAKVAGATHGQLMTSFEDPGPQYLIDGVRMRPGDAAWQPALESAYTRDLKPLCLCRRDGVPMYIAHYQQYVVKRLPETGDRHHPTCPSYEPPPNQSGLGEVLGEAVIERTPDRVEVRLEFPLTRRIGRPVLPGEPGQVRTEVAAHRRRLGLRGLVHLLLQRAGFNRWYPRMQGKRTWYVVRKHLMGAAQEIETKGVRLADVLLVPEPYSIEEADAIARRRRRTLSRLRRTCPASIRDTSSRPSIRPERCSALRRMTRAELARLEARERPCSRSCA